MKKTITVLLAFLMLFFCLVPTFITHADSGYNEAYDSFAVSEEYRTMASCYDLVQLMKMKYPEMDDGRVYRVCYDAMYVTWEANGSFENDLEKGEVTVNEKTLRFVNLTVPIVEEENGSCVANAQIDRNGAVEVSLQSGGTIVTRQLYDEGLRSDGDTLPKGYTVLYFHYNIPEEARKYLMVYTDQEILFYDLTFGWNENGPTKAPYTAQSLGEKFARQSKESAWIFFTTIVIPAIVVLIAPAVIVLVITLFFIWLTRYLCRPKPPKNGTEAIETAEDDSVA